MKDTTSNRSGKVSELIAFNIGEQQFCLCTTSVREIRGWTPATPLPHAPEFVLGVVNLRGVVLPIVDLAVRLGFPPTQPTARHAIIVVEVGDQVAGLLVDGVSDIFTAEDAQIQPTPEIAAETAQALPARRHRDGRPPDRRHRHRQPAAGDRARRSLKRRGPARLRDEAATRSGHSYCAGVGWASPSGSAGPDRPGPSSCGRRTRTLKPP